MVKYVIRPHIYPKKKLQKGGFIPGLFSTTARRKIGRSYHYAKFHRRGQRGGFFGMWGKSRRQLEREGYKFKGPTWGI